ncbi:Cytochrome P450 [Melia azedarach]|uniref:Cytochrome P450 n=3 Tax=Melia azedarach TaxID=155640 RepID=A0ACC1YQE7_MELAZ|nr:Cytochrome P450 [Melia azedarach]KAJ4725255.1 Cytochrome P450 [Melia azedarach]KAJ4725258.1 Cytochrome P450 [Melia azedarach]
MHSHMDVGFSSFSSILLPFLLFFFVLLKLWKISKTSNTTSNLPPGPWKLPIIGNMHQLLSSLPHHRLRDLAKKYGPLMHLQLGEISTIVVSSPEMAKEVMKTHDVIFASRPQDPETSIMTYGCSDIAFAPLGGYWRQLRKICISEVLSLKRVQSFRSIREEEVSNLINSISSKAGSVINLTDQIYSLMYGITSRAAFGSKRKDQQIFISAIKEGIELISGFNIANQFPSVKWLQHMTGIRGQVERVHQDADRVIENIINEHKKRKETLKLEKGEEVENLVDVLLKIQEHGGLEFSFTNDNIKAVIHDVFSAGSETSATTVDWAMSEMMKNPKVMKKAQAEVREVFNRLGKVDETGIDEMKFLKLAVKETLRLHPSAPLLIPRECGKSCEINGFNIPVKAKVLVNIWAIGRDPKYWVEPESFIPERFLDCSLDFLGNNFQYIPFGAGRRICPGTSFGLANVELPLAMLLYHFDWKLPNEMRNEDLDMSEAFGIAVKRRDELLLIPTPYLPSLVVE